MNILILGSGGREHSLAWAVKQNPKCDTLYCAPGNAGISKIAQCIDLNIENSSEIIKFCIDNDIYFVIIGNITRTNVPIRLMYNRQLSVF